MDSNTCANRIGWSGMATTRNVGLLAGLGLVALLASGAANDVPKHGATPSSSIQRKSPLRLGDDSERPSGMSEPTGGGGTGGTIAGGCIGAGGGFGIQTHTYGVVTPSPRSWYQPVGYSRSEGTAPPVTTEGCS